MKGRRWDGGQIGWDNFYRNRGMYLPFLIYPLTGPSYQYEDAQYSALWTEIILWKAPENVVCSWILFWNGEFWLQNIGFHCPDTEKKSEVIFHQKAAIWPVKALEIFTKLTLVVLAVNHSVCPCSLALKGSSFRTVVQIQMTWETVWNFIYDTHYICFTLCIQQEAEKQNL